MKRYVFRDHLKVDRVGKRTDWNRELPRIGRLWRSAGNEHGRRRQGSYRVGGLGRSREER